jgi:phosphoribosyl 1,2-cyclic phosphodiesterase
MFDIWGCRGSRSFLPARSRVGNNTSCYSILSKDQLFVLDAGWGLSALGYAMTTRPVLRGVKDVFLFVSHAHCDHWEGLKDVGWFWDKDNGLNVHICAANQALEAIGAGFAHPSYVPLEVLAMGTVDSLALHPLGVRETYEFGGWKVETFPLNHASGTAATRRTLDTFGYRLTGPSGSPCVAYLLDHEPTPETRALEDEMMQGVHLAVWDAHFMLRREQRFGHGSQEHAADVARRFPDTLVIAGHHGPMFSDSDLRKSFRAQAREMSNFELAVEGDSYAWHPKTARFSVVSR